LVMLDVGLPGKDGFALARWLREKSSRLGIIMVTSAADTLDRAVGLETGADDYITKPFEPRELLARVKVCCAAAQPIAPARRIAVIKTADVAGYSRLVGDDEEGTLAAIRAPPHLKRGYLGRRKDWSHLGRFRSARSGHAGGQRSSSASEVCSLPSRGFQFPLSAVLTADLPEAATHFPR
jgi:hypothetical protein